jgi:hypothetical protein
VTAGESTKIGETVWKGELSDKDLDARMARWVKTALSRLAKKPGFVAAGMPELRFCDFRRSCGDLRLQTGPNGSLSLVVGASPGTRATISLPDSFVDGMILNGSLDENAVSARKAGRAVRSVEALTGVADGLIISRVLSYRTPDGAGTLVVDLGYGDVDHGSDNDEASWPPCGCKALVDCMPRAPTLHHGDHIEVVVPLAKPVALGRPISAPPERLPSEAEIRASESQEPLAVRSDGVYATDPVCGADGKWNRRFLMLFSDGHFEHMDGNISPTMAASLMGHGHFVFDLGSYLLRGRRLQGTLKSEDAPDSALALEGIVENSAIWARVRDGKRPEVKGLRFKFAPFVAESSDEPLTHKHQH